MCGGDLFPSVVELKIPEGSHPFHSGVFNFVMMCMG
jgi:hypothetical protein